MLAVSHRFGDIEVSFDRAKLKLWFELEELKNKLADAAERGDSTLTGNLICSYLSAASDKEKSIFESASWFDVVAAFVDVREINTPKIKFPLFAAKKLEEEREIAWDYAGRSWIMWVHFLASSYGWSVEYISDLEIETGIGLIQEILVEEQLEREWQWSMSEIAYPYNVQTKKSSFVPLPRPIWMRQVDIKIKKIKMRKDMLPMGMINNMSGMGLHGTDEPMYQ